MQSILGTRQGRFSRDDQASADINDRHLKSIGGRGVSNTSSVPAPLEVAPSIGALAAILLGFNPSARVWQNTRHARGIERSPATLLKHLSPAGRHVRVGSGPLSPESKSPLLRRGYVDVSMNLDDASSVNTGTDRVSAQLREVCFQDLSLMLTGKEPTWENYAEDFKVIDQTGSTLRGLESAKLLWRLLRSMKKRFALFDEFQLISAPGEEEHSLLHGQWDIRLRTLKFPFLQPWRSNTPIEIKLKLSCHTNDTTHKVDYMKISDLHVNGREWFLPHMKLFHSPSTNLKRIRRWARDVKEYEQQAANLDSSQLDSLYEAAKNRAGIRAHTQALSEDEEAPKRRVLVMVEPSPFTYVSGYKNRFQALIRYLVEAGDDVLVVTTGPMSPKEFAGATVLEGATFQNAFSKVVPESYGVDLKIWRAVQEFQPDIIHASSPSAICMGGAIYSQKLGIPLVISYHTNLEHYIYRYCGALTDAMLKLYWFLMKMVHRNADLILTTSAQAQEDMRQHNLVWSGFRKMIEKDALHIDPLQVWAKGVDSEVFNPRYTDAAMRSRLTDGHPESPLMVHVGRLGPEKNLYFIKEIMKHLSDNHGLPDVRLAIVGGGPEMDGLKEHYNGTNTVLTGPLKGEALSQAYASADVFIMPSESETLGFVVLEAMASQTAVVAVKAGGIPDIIQRDGEVAFLYPPGDVEAAASRVASLMKDSTLRENMAEAGRSEVRQWDWRAATHKLRRQYSDADRLQKLRPRIAKQLPIWWNTS